MSAIYFGHSLTCFSHHQLMPSNRRAPAFVTFASPYQYNFWLLESKKCLSTHVLVALGSSCVHRTIEYCRNGFLATAKCIHKMQKEWSKNGQVEQSEKRIIWLCNRTLQAIKIFNDTIFICVYSSLLPWELMRSGTFQYLFTVTLITYTWNICQIFCFLVFQYFVSTIYSARAVTAS